jgi:hypothetical protein
MTSPAYSPNKGGQIAFATAPSSLRDQARSGLDQRLQSHFAELLDANAHFDAACAAAIARDDAAYERHMAAFRALSADWTAKA